MDDLIRLTKRLASTGLYSRRDADKLVANGHVTVDGVVAEPGLKVTPDGYEVILIDGVPVERKSTAVYKFHKPIGVLSSYYDPNNKTTLMIFPKLAAKKLGYSGRLDYNSEGLMLFTSDGDLIHRLQRSEFNVEKEYLVHTDKDITDIWVKKLESGLILEDEHFLPCTVKRLKKQRYSVILTEGKKRQVRRMFKMAGAEVERLIRVRIANIVLTGLAAGELKELSRAELEELRVCTGLE
jgi:23S rRNA pseudouridine2605 synthase/23S rRNA pseudouridine2604 synthase